MKIQNLHKNIYILGLYNRWRAAKSYMPSYIEFAITGKCNSYCVMCNVWKIEKQKPELLKEELTTEQIIYLFTQLSKMGTDQIFLSGGEPTLREDLPLIIKSAKNNNIQVHLVTNGSLMTEKLANDLVTSGLDRLSFSIEGPTQEIHEKLRKVKGGLVKAVNGIRLINSAKETQKSKNPSINVSQIVSRTNYRHIEEMLDLKLKWQYDTINFQPIIGKVPGCENLFLENDDLEYLHSRLASIKSKIHEVGLPASTISPLNSLFKNRESTNKGLYAESFNKKVLCFAPWNMATIDPFGNVYPCCFALTFQNFSEDLEHGFWGNDDFCMGNIKINGFKGVWAGERYNKFRVAMKNPPAFTMCKWCNYRSFKDMVLTGLFKDPSLLFRLHTKK